MKENLYVLCAGLGYADVENRLPCKPDTVMRIASISKSITMTAVAKQMEIGQLDLDKPIQAYVPHFPEKIVDGEKVGYKRLFSYITYSALVHTDGWMDVLGR